MKFKTILLISFLISLNLSAFEPMNPSIATKKASDDYGQVDGGAFCDADYGTDFITPSFKCYDDKEKYKFKEYSLEDFICQSRSTAFRDNYFADLYNLIVKENPNLKEKAQKIARERIAKTKKECINKFSKEFKQNCKLTFSISGAIHCSRSYYRSYMAKLALMLYENDKELFKRIYGEDYEHFKEVFEDTLKYVPIENGSIPRDVKRAEINNDFLQKYKSYHYDDDYPQIDDMLYIMLVQYSLIDKNGHLVLPENRKNDVKN